MSDGPHPADEQTGDRSPEAGAGMPRPTVMMWVAAGAIAVAVAAAVIALSIGGPHLKRNTGGTSSEPCQIDAGGRSLRGFVDLVRSGVASPSDHGSGLFRDHHDDDEAERDDIHEWVGVHDASATSPCATVSTTLPQPPPAPTVSTTLPQPPPAPTVSTTLPQPPPAPTVSTTLPQPPPAP